MAIGARNTFQFVETSLTVEEILRDYRTAYRSRIVSQVGRREVLSGKAKFGIFGDGKEIPQLAMAHVYQPGDFRSGYYRDQTLMFAVDLLSIREFFAQLYAHTDLEADPATGGRAMNAHFATRSLNPDGSWKSLTAQRNTSSDIAPTGAQMPRLVGLGYASRLYRELEALHQFGEFSNNGNEIAFGTIGNASTAEGLFWESINAIGVLRAPVVMSIWDDGYGISVPNEFQMVKHDLSELLKGFQRQPGSPDGFDLYTVAGWDYPALIDVYQRAAHIARSEHVPSLIHVIEVTQPSGHSTSGSHERYKPAERLAWEEEFDGIARFRNWLLENKLTSEKELENWEEEDRASVEEERKAAWEAYSRPILNDRAEVIELLDRLGKNSSAKADVEAARAALAGISIPYRRDAMAAIREGLLVTKGEANPVRQELIEWRERQNTLAADRFSSHLYTQTALKVAEVPAQYAENAPLVQGFEILNACFDTALANDPRVIAFGEDVGRMGDVNQGFRGLQAKHGRLRVDDTGIREATIIGQAIGLAMRGLRPIAEIQYLDYVLFALQTLSDDLATLLWRTKGGQKAPVIVRTRGHRLEGIWHSGSPMGALVHLLRGMYILTPRNNTQAAGFYNTMLRADEPALIIEVLNGYRLKERLPENIGEFTVPPGVPEVLRPGNDLTLVTYGACCRIAMTAAEQLARSDIDLEVIDVQSLLPFDRPGIILESLKRTGRVIFMDEDVPGGASAYMMQETLEKQGGYEWLDAAPRTLTGKEHRPAYGSDGDYWSKPNVEQVMSLAAEMMYEVNPKRYPRFDV